MSNKNNEAKVNATPSRATENKNAVANELKQLQESNANLIAERESLMTRVKELQEKLEDTEAAKSRMYNYWQREEEKVKMLLAFMKSGIKFGEYMTAGECIAKIVENM